MMRIEWDSQVSSKVYTGCIYPLLLDPLGYMSGVMGRVWFGFGANYQFNVCTDHWWLESSYWCHFAWWPMEKYHVQLPEKKRVSCHFACYLIIFFPFELYSCVAIQVALLLYNKFFLFWLVTWLKAATSWLQQWAPSNFAAYSFLVLEECQWNGFEFFALQLMICVIFSLIYDVYLLTCYLVVKILCDM